MNAGQVLQQMHDAQQAEVAGLAPDDRLTYAVVRRWVTHVEALAVASLRVGQRVHANGYPGTVRELHTTGELAGLVEVRLGSGDVIVPASEVVR